jgi:hypothetical protein
MKEEVEIFHFVRLGEAARYSARRRGFFTPFPRRFLGGSELLPFFPQEKTASDIFAGPMLKHRAPLEKFRRKAKI